jgi:hypothetical protein
MVGFMKDIMVKYACYWYCYRLIVYLLYEGKNDYGVWIGRNIAIWTCWLNKRLTCWLCGYEWGGTMKRLKWKKFEKNKTYLRLVISIFLANWLVNKDYHGFQLERWNYCCDLNNVKWPWIMLFMHQNKLEVEKDFQGMKILVV